LICARLILIAGPAPGLTRLPGLRPAHPDCRACARLTLIAGPAPGLTRLPGLRPA
jgi:hypothetical protein